MSIQEHKSEGRVGDTLICAGTVPTWIRQELGQQYRQAQILLPRFTHQPTVKARFYNSKNQADVFSSYIVEINNLENQTQIMITATNPNTVFAFNTYLCDYIIVGNSPCSLTSSS